MVIDTSLNLNEGLGIATVAWCPSCGDEESQGDVTATIDDEVANDVSAQPSGK